MHAAVEGNHFGGGAVLTASSFSGPTLCGALEGRVVVAVNQIGIATTLINTLFMAVVGAVALALGLAFGLGGRETAATIVRNWYESSQRAVPKMQYAADSVQRDAQESSVAVRATGRTG